LIDYLDILLTKGSSAFMQAFLCPCGGTLFNFNLHWINLRQKNENIEHHWLYEAYTTFEYAVKGRKLDHKNNTQGAGCGTIQAHKVDEYFEKGWKQLVLP
jgi:hypothetical protein